MIVPETIVMPLDGSPAEALSGSLRMVQELISNSLVSKRINGIFPHKDIISELDAHSKFSLLDGTSHPKDLVRSGAEMLVTRTGLLVEVYHDLVGGGWFVQRLYD